MTIGTVEVRSGIPNVGTEKLDDGTFAYPRGTSDIVKILRERGFQVEYDRPKSERVVVSHNAAEVWLPILAFASNVLANIPANIISSVIMDYLAPLGLDRSKLHVEFKVKNADGSEATFKADGSGPDVVRSIDAFQQRYKQ